MMLYIHSTRMNKSHNQINKNMNRYHRNVIGAMNNNKKTQLTIASTLENLPNGTQKEWRVITRILKTSDDDHTNKPRRLRSLLLKSRSITNQQQPEEDTNQPTEEDTKQSSNTILNHINQQQQEC